MATMREIKRRQNGIDNIRQITRAMYMVAAAKMRRVEQQVKEGRPYAQKLSDVLGRLAAGGVEVDHPLLQERETGPAVVVVVTGDRGLCGSYNANVVRLARETMDDEEEQPELVTVGRYARDWFRRRDYAVHEAYINLGEEIEFIRAREIARHLQDRFLSGDVREVRIFYTEFISALRQHPTELRILPLGALAQEAGDEAAGEAGSGADAGADEATSQLDFMDYIYEPDAAFIFEELLPKFMQIRLYRALMEAKASEHAARMRAMQNATDNAKELLEELRLQFNRARQAAITAEIAEIVGGAEALQGR